MGEPIITVALKRTNFFRRIACLFCDGTSDKDGVNAEVFSAVVNVRENQSGADFTGYVICAECLAKDKRQLEETIAESAAWYRERAAELDTIGANLPPLPTYAEWKQANEANAAAERIARTPTVDDSEGQVY